jgi:hypothetical protein
MVFLNSQFEKRKDIFSKNVFSFLNYKQQKAMKKENKVPLTQYQRTIEGMMHVGIILVVVALFLKVLIL